MSEVLFNIRPIIEKNDIACVSQKRIFFGHQSVGYNIVEGIEQHCKELDFERLSVVESDNIDSLEGTFFTHSRVGKNGDPIGKINDFAAKIDGGIGGRVDIALFKFCYVDFNRDTNVDSVFTHYVRTMDKLVDNYPATTFCHVTVPLTINKTGIKETAKRIFKLGKGSHKERNIQRTKFNNLLIDTYQDKQPIFDLAREESSWPDGQRHFSIVRGEEIYSLIPDYTYDGGHLSDLGKRIVSAELIRTLANLKE